MSSIISVSGIISLSGMIDPFDEFPDIGARIYIIREIVLAALNLKHHLSNIIVEYG